MLLQLGHPALLLLAGILRGVTAQDLWYETYQLPSVLAQAGNSVTLPCNFTYPPDIEPVKDLRVYWRRGGFHGEFIYNHSEKFTHPHYQGRIVLVGDPWASHTASICIRHLRTSDANLYVCQLRVQKNNGKWEQWRNIPGTKLNVSDGDSVTDTPCTKPTPTTMQIPVQGVAPLIGGAVGGAILLAVLIGLAVYMCRKRRAHQQKEPPVGREEPQLQAQGRGEYIEIGTGGHGAPPPEHPPAPPEPGLLYAALNFAAPGAAPRSLETDQAPGAETLYSAVRIR